MEGWVRRKLKDCFKLKSGDGLTAKKMIPGDYPVFGGNSQAGTHNQFNLSGDNVIVGRVGALCGNARHITENIWLTDNAFKIVDKKYDFENDFLTYLLNYRNLRSLARQAAQPVISNSSLSDLELEFPLDVAEQKHIVAILDQVFADIEQARAKTEQNLRNARELFESYLQQVFSQRGEGWVDASILEITTKLGDGLHGTPKYDPEGEFFFINGNNLDDGKITIKEKTKRVSEEEYNKHKKPLNDRTVFVSINGTLGNVAFYNDEKVILGKSACYFNLQKGVNKEYVKFVIESPLFQKYALREATGATIKNVSLKTMRAFQVPLAPEKKQAEIVHILKALKQQYFHLESIYSKKLNSLDELKKSILQKAFSGELTKTLEGGANKGAVA